jgi:hypothetical protein
LFGLLPALLGVVGADTVDLGLLGAGRSLGRLLSKTLSLGQRRAGLRNELLGLGLGGLDLRRRLGPDDLGLPFRIGA